MSGSSRAGVMAVFLRTVVSLRVGVVNRPKNQREFRLFHFTIMTISLQKELKNHQAGSCNQRTIDNNITHVAR